MSAGRYDIKIDQGSSLDIRVTMTNVDNSPFVLTGWTPRGQIRKTHQHPVVDAHFTFLITSAVLGKMTIQLSAEVTDSISAGETIEDQKSQYVYDIELEHTDGTIKRILDGIVYVSASVTH